MRRSLLTLAAAVPFFMPIPASLAQNNVKPAAAVPATVDLPVTRAVLFSSGVAYFEHSGAVEGDAVLRLLFKADQINDVLKSMILTDENGGTVASVNYPSNDPVTRSLKSFGVDVSGSPTLPSLLAQLRGARVTVASPDKISGAILAIEAQTKIVGNPPAQITEHVLSIVTESGIRSIPLSSVSSITLEDARLQDELNKALALLVSSRDTNRKPVEVRFTGKGKRNVRVGYLVESPVWKTSYRLDLAGEKPLLQGWAIVENTSESDWSGVNLALVSGRPISFTMDLYTPLYVQRPVVVPELFASLRPRIYEEGQAMADAPAAPPALRKMAGEGSSGGARGGFAGRAAAAEALSDDRLVSMNATARLAPVQSAAAAGSVGELFQYALKAPVDLPRRRSAMLPIVNKDIAAEKVSIYNPAVLATRPLNGVWLTNNTGLNLLGGPITVFDAGSYAGDAQIDHLAPGDKRLLSYSVDLAVNVDITGAATSQVSAVRIIKGVAQVTRINTFDQTYSIVNKSDAPRKIIVEHPLVAGRELVEPQAAEEKTPQHYRFRVPVEAGKTVKFLVRERQPAGEAVALLDTAADGLAWITTNNQIDPKVRDAIVKVITLKRQHTELVTQQATLRNEVNTITQEQDRLRKNIETAGRDSTLGKRYLEKLNEQETRLETLAKLISDLQRQAEDKRAELARFLAELNIGG